MVCLFTLVGLTLFAVYNARYLTNFFLGPFSIDRPTLLATTDSGKLFHYFVRVTGDEVLDTGFQWVLTDDSGSKAVDATFVALRLGDRLLLTKDTGGSASLDYTGALVSIPEQESSMILASLEKDIPGVTDAFLPFMLDTENFRQPGYIGLAITVPIFLLAFWYLLVALWRIADPAHHPMMRKLERLGPSEVVTAQVEQEMLSEHPRIGFLHFTQSFLVNAQSSSINVARLNDLVWGYKRTTQRRVNGIPTGKTFTALFFDRFGASLIVAAKEKEIDQILVVVFQRVPWMVAGWKKDLEKSWKKERAAFLAAIDEQRRKLV